MAKILVVDDESPIVNLLEKFLEEKNYDVVTASNGEEALEEFHRENPSIVLLDIHMPGKSGIEVLKELKQANPHVGVVMITGIADEDMGRSALKPGALDYITKPFDFDYLERVLWLKLKLLT